MNVINMKLTTAGQAAVLNSKNTGVSLDLSHIQFGSGNKTPDGSEIALIAPHQYSQISSGLKISPTQIRMAAIFNGSSSYDVCEIGVWSGVPGVVGSVLFAYCSNLTGRIASMSVGVDFIFSHDMAVDAAVGTTLNIVVDPSGTAAALLIMASHEVAYDPHHQYSMRPPVTSTIVTGADFGDLTKPNLLGNEKNSFGTVIDLAVDRDLGDFDLGAI